MKIAQIPPHRFDLVREGVFDICREIRVDQIHKTHLKCIRRLEEM